MKSKLYDLLGSRVLIIKVIGITMIGLLIVTFIYPSAFVTDSIKQQSAFALSPSDIQHHKYVGTVLPKTIIVVSIGTGHGSGSGKSSGSQSGSGITSGSHSDGLGQTYSSSQPAGTPGIASTYTQLMAMSAASAWTSGSSIPYHVYCSYGSGNSEGYEVDTPSESAIWIYTGSAAGYVHLNLSSPIGICPTAGIDQVWN